MIQAHHCPECGAVVPAIAPAGLCPKCLLHAGLEGRSELAPAPTQPSPESLWQTAPQQPAELAGRFPQLEVLELLGHGGMGAVYKARHVGLDRLVAVKILPPEISRDEAFAQRFTREARALARLSHPNIVTVFDFGQAGGLYYLVMEFVDGANLRQLIQARAMTPPEALAIVPQICDALQFAHEEGIVHRDIKPENILLDKRGRVKIADFGLAKLLGRSDPQHALTGSHQVMGTLRYMAPEQMEGARAVDHRADIYSLGVVFYELLTGELPLGRFAPPSKKVQIDMRLDEVVLRALEKEPEQRYQHASEVKTEIESICSRTADPVEIGPHGRIIHAGAAPSAPKFRPPRMLGFVATINLLLGIVIMLVAAGLDYAESTVEMDRAYWLFATTAPWIDYLSGTLLFAGSIGVYLRAWWGRRFTLASTILAIVTLVIYLPILARYEAPAIHADIVQTLTAEGVSPEEAEFVAIGGMLLLFGVIMGLGLFWTVFILVYFNRASVAAALGDPGQRRPGDPPQKEAQDAERWAARWRSWPAGVRNALQSALTVVYLLCLATFVSFRGSGGHGADKFQVGLPDPWLTWSSNADGFQWGLHFSSSIAVLAVGLAVLAAVRRLEFWERGSVHALGWHYAIWSVMIAVALGAGVLSHVLSSLG